MSYRKCGWRGKRALANALRQGLDDGDVFQHLSEFKTQGSYESDAVRAIQEFYKLMHQSTDNQIRFELCKYLTTRIESRISRVQTIFASFALEADRLDYARSVVRIFYPLFLNLLWTCDCEPFLILISRVFDVLQSSLSIIAYIQPEREKNSESDPRKDKVTKIQTNRDFVLQNLMLRFSCESIEVRNESEVGEIKDADSAYLADIQKKLLLRSSSNEFDSTSATTALLELLQYNSVNAETNANRSLQRVTLLISGLFNDNAFFTDIIPYSVCNTAYLNNYYILRPDRVFLDTLRLVLFNINDRNHFMIRAMLSCNSVYQFCRSSLLFCHKLFNSGFNEDSFEIRALVKSIATICEIVYQRPLPYKIKINNLNYADSLLGIDLSRMQLDLCFRRIFSSLLTPKHKFLATSQISFSDNRRSLAEVCDEEELQKDLLVIIGNRHCAAFRLSIGCSLKNESKYVKQLIELTQCLNTESAYIYVKNHLLKLAISHETRNGQVIPTLKGYDAFLMIQSPQIILMLIGIALQYPQDESIIKLLVFALLLPLFTRCKSSIQLFTLLANIKSTAECINCNQKNLAVEEKQVNELISNQSTKSPILVYVREKIFLSLGSLIELILCKPQLSVQSAGSQPRHIYADIYGLMNIELFSRAFFSISAHNNLSSNEVLKFDLCVDKKQTLEEVITVCAIEQLQYWYARYWLYRFKYISDCDLKKYILSQFKTIECFNYGNDVDLKNLDFTNSDIKSLGEKWFEITTNYLDDHCDLSSHNEIPQKLNIHVLLFHNKLASLLYESSGLKSVKIFHKKFSNAIKFCLGGPFSLINQSQELKNSLLVRLQESS